MRYTAELSTGRWNRTCPYCGAEYRVSGHARCGRNRWAARPVMHTDGYVGPGRPERCVAFDTDRRSETPPPVHATYHQPTLPLRHHLRREIVPTAAKNRLVIVESPAKAKTISGYLGPGYVVEA